MLLHVSGLTDASAGLRPLLRLRADKNLAVPHGTGPSGPLPHDRIDDTVNIPCIHIPARNASYSFLWFQYPY